MVSTQRIQVQGVGRGRMGGKTRCQKHVESCVVQLGLHDESTSGSWKGFQQVTWLLDLVSEGSLDPRVTVHADRIKVNPNLIHVSSLRRSTLSHLYLQWVAVLLSLPPPTPSEMAFLSLKIFTKNELSRVMGVVKGMFLSETSDAMMSQTIALLKARWRLSGES